MKTLFGFKSSRLLGALILGCWVAPQTKAEFDPSGRWLALYQWSGNAHSNNPDNCPTAVAIRKDIGDKLIAYVSNASNHVSSVFLDGWCYLNTKFDDYKERFVEFSHYIDNLHQAGASKVEFLYSDDCTDPEYEPSWTAGACSQAAYFSRTAKQAGRYGLDAFHLDMEISTNVTNAKNSDYIAQLVDTLLECKKHLANEMPLILDTNPDKSKSWTYHWDETSEYFQILYPYMRQYDGLLYNEIFAHYVDALRDMNYRTGSDELITREKTTIDVIKSVKSDEVEGFLGMALEVGCSPPGDEANCPIISMCGRGMEYVTQTVTKIVKNFQDAGDYHIFDQTAPFAIQAYCDGNQPNYINGTTVGNQCTCCKNNTCTKMELCY